MEERPVLVFCLSGPYRRAAQLLESERSGWMPWGYRRNQVSEEVARALGPGTEAEIWAVDDIRKPVTARHVANATVDFRLATNDYLALTILFSPADLSSTDEQDVLRMVERGLLAFVPKQLNPLTLKILRPQLMD